MGHDTLRAAAVTAEQNDTEHPLIDGVVYRLETTTLLGGRKYPYEVVYCEAFKFIDDEVFYAASSNKTRCPEEHKLNKVGEYQISDDSLIIHIKGSRQIWTTKKTYRSRVHKDTENYLLPSLITIVRKLHHAKTSAQWKSV